MATGTNDENDENECEIARPLVCLGATGRDRQAGDVARVFDTPWWLVRAVLDDFLQGDLVNRVADCLREWGLRQHVAEWRTFYQAEQSRRFRRLQIHGARAR